MKFVHALVLSLVILLANSLPPTQASIKYWDVNGATPGAGGATPSGTWDMDVTNDWSTSSTGNIAPVSWASGDSAVFSAGSDATGAYTVTINGSLSAAAITIEDGAVTLASGSVNVGTGTVTLLAGSTLATDSAARIPVDAGGKFNVTNATLRSTNSSFAGSFVDPDATITVTGNLTADYTVSNQIDIIQTNSVISGSGSFTKTGAGVLAIASASTYSGATIINDGELRIRSLANRLPIGTAATVNSPGILNLHGLNQAIGSLSGNGTVGIAGTGSATLTVGDSTSTTFSGVIADIANAGAGAQTTGIGSLSKVSSGTLTLTGANTYSGTTTITFGTLRIGNGGSSGTLGTGNTLIATGALLDFNRSDAAYSYGGVISSSGAVQKDGPGTVTLTGANTYSGGTTISAGTLLINNASASGTGTGTINVNGGTLGGTGSISGLININSGGHLAPGASAGTLTALNNVAFMSGAVLDYDLANTTTVGSGVNDLLSITGNLTLGNSLALNLNAYQGDLTNGPYKLITYTGSLTGNTSGWTIGSNNAANAHNYTFSTATPGEIQLIVAAATATWTGAVSGNWDTNSNWSTNAKPTSSYDVTFATPIPSTGATITLTNGEAVKSLTINDNYTFSGGNLNVNAGTINVASGKTAVIASALIGSAAITKGGSGTLVLTGTNTYAGLTTIGLGALQIGNGGTSGTLGAGDISITSFGSLSFNRSDSAYTYAGGIFGSGPVTKTGIGMITLTGGDSYLGNTTISAGTLQIGNGGTSGTLGNSNTSIAPGSTLIFNRSNAAYIYSGAISGNGAIIQAGIGTITFTGANTFAGGTTIGAGVLQIGNGGTSGTLGTGNTVVGGGTLAFNRSDTAYVYAGAISGSGAVTKNGSGTITLTGANTYLGNTTINAGTLQIGNGGSSGTLGIGNTSIVSGATLAFNRSDSTYSYSGAISGGGSLTKNGAGTITLTGNMNYGGVTTISAGTLAFDSLIANNDVVVANAGSLLQVLGNFQQPSGNSLHVDSNSAVIIGTGTPQTGKVLVSTGGTLGGRGTVATDVVVDGGKVSPGASPGTLVINGYYTQAADSVLQIEVSAPGTAHDLLQVTQTASLNGRLEVPIINGYVPAAGDEITFLTAHAAPPTSVSGVFNSLFSANLSTVNPNVAMKVVYNPSDVRLQFIATSSTIQFNGQTPTAAWSDPATWTTNTVPNSANIITVQNMTAAAQRVNVSSGNAFVHQLIVVGNVSTITIGIQNSNSLSATIGTTIDANAAIELGTAGVPADRGYLVSSTVDVKGGGRLSGNGTVVGSLSVGKLSAAQTSTLSPGFSVGHIDVEGGYEQGPNGTLLIDIDSTNQFDTIAVSGAAQLGGKLSIDASHLSSFLPGLPMPIVTASSLAGTFNTVSWTGNNNVYFTVTYNNGGGAGGVSASVGAGGDASVIAYHRGDMNADGQFTQSDFDLFVTALMNPQAFFNLRYTQCGSCADFGQRAGDFNGNGRLDFEDIAGFQSELGGMGMGAMVPNLMAAFEHSQVPEPTCFALALSPAMLIAVFAARRAKKRRSSHG